MIAVEFATLEMRIPEMKVEMIQDEFDKYFARAAIGRDVDYNPPSPASYIKEHESVTRRGSVPIDSLKAPETGTGVRRTRSCKYPARRRRDRSTSPRDSSVSPKARSRTESISGESSSTLTPGDSYIHERTLRAPSPSGIKCRSAPHSRSSSWKKSKRKGDLDLEVEPRPRTGSVPLEDTLSQLEKLKLLQQEEGLFPVRNFCMSPKGLVNRGDSFKRRSNQSVASEGACSAGSAPDGSNRSRALSVNSQGSGSDNSSGLVCRVLMMGDHGVGKTALLHQFMTSEYMGATDTSFDDENEITISVSLNGEDTTLDFIDVRANESIKDHADVEAFVLVYSITDRHSFEHVIERLGEIRRDVGANVAVIVVANKSDLVRTRQVTDEEAREMCMSYDTKFIEVSAVLNHRVDDLLVGIVTQIRLYHRRFHVPAKPKPEPEKVARAPGDCVPRAAKGLLDKFFRKQSNVSRSCDDLLAL